MKNTLEDLKNVKLGWDGYDAEIPLPEVINRASVILTELKKNEMEPIRIGPSAEGGVAFIYAGKNTKRAYIDILNNGEIDTVLYDLNGNCNTIGWPTDYIKEITKLAEQIREYLE